MSVLMIYLLLQTVNQLIFMSQEIIYSKYVLLNRKYVNFDLIDNNIYLNIYIGETKQYLKTNSIYISVSNYIHLIQSIVYMSSIMIICFFLYSITYSLSNFDFHLLYIISIKQTYYFQSLNIQMLIVMIIQIEFLIFVSFLKNTFMVNIINIQLISLIGIFYVSNQTLRNQNDDEFMVILIKIIILQVISLIIYLLFKRHSYRIYDIIQYYGIKINTKKFVLLLIGMLSLFIIFLLNIGQIQLINNSLNGFESLQNSLQTQHIQIYEIFRMTYGLYIFYYIFLLIIISWTQLMIITSFRIIGQVYAISLNREIMEQFQEKQGEHKEIKQEE